jgi:hypothetical protein
MDESDYRTGTHYVVPDGIRVVYPRRDESIEIIKILDDCHEISNQGESNDNG